MKSLYEVVNNLEKFTNELKEELVIKRNSPSVENILLTYDNGGINFPLLEILSFNFYSFDDDMGYLCVDIESISLGGFSIDYLCKENSVNKVSVYFDDDTRDIYSIDWCSNFEKLEDNIYLILFKGKKEVSED